MKKLLLPLFLMVALAANAQQCEYAKNENDPFLKIKKVETKETIIWNWGQRLSFSFANYGGNKFILANMTLNSNELFSSGNKMILLFEDKSTIELDLTSESGKSASFGKSIGSGYHAYKLMYKLPSTEQLEGKKLEGVRIYTTSNYLEFKPGSTGKELGGAGKEKKMERIAKLFSKQSLDCINI